MTVAGIKDAGHRNTATTVPCCRGCCSDNWISRVSRAFLMTYNWRSSTIATEPHLFHKLCLHY